MLTTPELLAPSPNFQPAGRPYDRALRRARRERPLIRAIRALAFGHGRLIAHEQVSWASVTFTGSRHRLVMRYEGEAAVAGGEAMIALLEEHEFDLPSEMVASAEVTWCERREGPAGEGAGGGADQCADGVAGGGAPFLEAQIELLTVKDA